MTSSKSEKTSDPHPSNEEGGSGSPRTFPRTPRVYIPNNSFHDFSPASEWGEVVYLTEGLVNRFDLNTIFRQVQTKLEDAEAHDLLLLSSLPAINIAAATILAMRFGRLNFLLYKNGPAGGHYIRREIYLANSSA